MRFLKSASTLALAALFLGLSIHCGGGGGGNPPPVNTPVNTIAVTGVSVEASLSLIATRTDQLHATITPANATNKNLTWTSDTPAVATVSASGLVTGVAAGTAHVTVTTVDGSHTAACTVTVTPTAPSFTTQPSPISVVDGQSASFTVSVSGNPTPTIVWERSSGGTTWAPVDGVSGTTYTFTAALTDNGTQFRATASNGVGSSATSNSATLTVTLGSLTVNITGLGSLNADVTVTGPFSYSQHLTASQTLTNLVYGTYTITAVMVTDTTQPGLGLGWGGSHSGTLGPANLLRYPLQLVQTVAVSGAAAVAVDYPAAILTVQIPDVSHSGSTVPMDFALVPAGSFTMGETYAPESQPVHTVTMGEAFYVAKSIVTQAQWKAVMGATNNPSSFQSDNLPVETVSWNDIRTSTTNPDYTCFLDQLNSARPGYGFRLPSEAEWEYACRAGTTTAYFFGSDSTNLSSYAVIRASSTGSVCSLAPNPWGLYDIEGNVAELIEDDYHASYTGAPVDGSAWVDSPRGFSRVFRGTSWNMSNYSLPECFRSAYRSNFYSNPLFTDNRGGFRVVMSAVSSNP